MGLIKPVSILLSLRKVALSSNSHLVCRGRTVCLQNQSQVSAMSSYCTTHLLSWSKIHETEHILMAHHQALLHSSRMLMTFGKCQAYHTTALLHRAEKKLNDSDEANKSSNATETGDRTLPDSSSESSDKTSHLVPASHKVLELLDQNGEPLGSMPQDEAIALSKERKLKLVLVNPQSRPYPIYRLMSPEDFNLEQVQIKEKLKKKKMVAKEVRISCGIGEHDLQVKKRHIKGWFDDEKHEVQVKLVVQGGKGRKTVTEEDQLAIANRLMSGLEDQIIFGNKPKMVGKHKPSLVVQLRRRSIKERAEYNKQKNMEES